MMKNYRILAFLLLVLILETAATPESTGDDVESTGVVSSESKPDVIIKLIKRGETVSALNTLHDLCSFISYFFLIFQELLKDSPTVPMNFLETKEGAVARKTREEKLESNGTN
ncbi:hypothetical protein CRE_03659 [Caenorhabditis remanei]|uniref:Uncharacterized protein n=1 Tax=Caenorhabditis remanei TaxID=31234 RepID=E3LXI5_CAERE|nr:hypothetical protein CRE_03659 [Caenorhabditis remanei]